MLTIPPHLQRDYAHCRRITRRHYENFPVASVLVPAAMRPHICAIYAYARRADDFADEAQFSGRRMPRLDAWRNMLDLALAGTPPPHPVFRALAHTRAVFDIPDEPLTDLLSAFRQDVVQCRYDDFSTVLDYCRRSADPVGRMVLILFGHRDPEWFAWSDAICTGLQLANFWQDVAIDAAKDRIYLPREDMDRFGVSEADILSGRGGDGFRELLAFQVARTRTLFQRGRPLCMNAPGRLGLELRMVWLGGMGILDAVERVNFDVYRRRPRHGRKAVAGYLWNAVVPGRFARTHIPTMSHA